MILSYTADFAGQIGVEPRLTRLVVPDNFTTSNFYTPGFLNQIASQQGVSVLPTDYVFASSEDGTIRGIFSVTINPLNGVVTLSNFVNSSVGSGVTGNLPEFSNSTTIFGDSGIAANKVLTSSFVNPDIEANVVYFSQTATFAQLAAGGNVTLYPSSGTKQYVVLILNLNSGGTNFSGGGGDRNGFVTDDITVYANIPAATMQALDNSSWGSANITFPPSGSLNTPTAAGANLLFSYSGGTTDYTAGQLTINGLLVRVA